MPLGVGKDCFPAPTCCRNCERKESSQVRRKTVPKEEYKRCSGCHIMTYCDKDCQREHWIRVHKKHCKFLSGKVPVNNSEHNAATCLQCIDQKQGSLYQKLASLQQIKSQNSPKTVCIIDEVNNIMKKSLSEFFGFHAEGKQCNCSLQFAVELPFSLGEVYGQYMEMGGTGLDAMLAHAFTIVSAMIIKAGNDQKIESALGNLSSDIIRQRIYLWCNIINNGRPRTREMKHLWHQVNSLKRLYGASNAWWKALTFSVRFVVETNYNLNCNSNDPRSLEDPRFPNLKQIDDYCQSQLQNQAIVCEKQMWAKFMLWPVLVNGSLAIVLPPGTRCQNCFTELCGEVGISTDKVGISPEGTYPTLPILLPDVGSDGALMASCPRIRNQRCYMICFSKNVRMQLQMENDENRFKQFQFQRDLFETEARDCDFCLKSSLSSHRCSACLTVQYCSTTCQKQDLEFHMTVCSTWAKDKSRRILGKEKQRNHWKEVIDKNKKSFKK